jgi:hypothetical protein
VKKIPVRYRLDPVYRENTKRSNKAMRENQQLSKREICEAHAKRHCRHNAARHVHICRMRLLSAVVCPAAAINRDVPMQRLTLNSHEVTIGVLGVGTGFSMVRVRCHASDGRRVMWQGETCIQCILHHVSRLFETLLAIFIVDGGVVKVRMLAALNHHGDQVLQLRPGVARVMDVRLGLDDGQYVYIAREVA